MAPGEDPVAVAVARGRSSGRLQLEGTAAVRATEAKAIQCLVFLVFNL